MKLKILAEVKKYIHYSMWLRQCKIIWIPAGWIFTTYNTIRMIGDRRGTGGTRGERSLNSQLGKCRCVTFDSRKKLPRSVAIDLLTQFSKELGLSQIILQWSHVCQCWSLSPVWQCRTQQWTRSHCPAGREEPASKRSLSSKSPCQGSESFRNH